MELKEAASWPTSSLPFALSWTPNSPFAMFAVILRILRRGPEMRSAKSMAVAKAKAAPSNAQRRINCHTRPAAA